VIADRSIVNFQVSVSDARHACGPEQGTCRCVVHMTRAAKEVHAPARGAAELRLRVMAVNLERPSDAPIRKSATEARQGVTGHNVRYVLMISLGAALLLLACIWLGFFFS
jgi:hypothetical protein